MGEKPAKLNVRQKRFVEEYLIDLNGTRAAKRAGYSESYAHSEGAQLLRDPLVGAAVKKAMEKRARRIRVTADRVLREYARIAFADIRRVTNWDEKLGLVAKPIKEMSDDDAAAIVEVRSDANSGTLRVRLHDKKRALDAIARHLGLFSGHAPTAPQSPAVLAERVRELIRSRLAELARPDEDE